MFQSCFQHATEARRDNSIVSFLISTASFSPLVYAPQPCIIYVFPVGHTFSFPLSKSLAH